MAQELRAEPAELPMLEVLLEIILEQFKMEVMLRAQYSQQEALRVPAPPVVLAELRQLVLLLQILQMQPLPEAPVVQVLLPTPEVW